MAVERVAWLRFNLANTRGSLTKTGPGVDPGHDRRAPPVFSVPIESTSGGNRAAKKHFVTDVFEELEIGLSALWDQKLDRAGLQVQATPIVIVAGPDLDTDFTSIYLPEGNTWTMLPHNLWSYGMTVMVPPNIVPSIPKRIH
ncbi:hypothetical protein Pelo_16545 [Pelomyxa schiedti]|nr:hypothetical protein Pelo_16545 [Pelomyxa schiedti]